MLDLRMLVEDGLCFFLGELCQMVFGDLWMQDFALGFVWVVCRCFFVFFEKVDAPLDCADAKEGEFHCSLRLR